MLKTKKIVTTLLAMILLMGLFTQVNATADNPLDLPTLNVTTENPDTNTTTEPDLDTNTTTDPETNTTNDITAPIIQPTTNTNSTGSTYANSDTLPQTGVTEDITVMFFIIVCAVSAIYAYRKIRDYRS